MRFKKLVRRLGVKPTGRWLSLSVVTVATTLDKKAVAAAVLPQLPAFFQEQMSTSVPAELEDWTEPQIELLDAVLRALLAVDCHPPLLQPQDRHHLERCAMHRDLCPLAERLLLYFHTVPQEAAAASAFREQQPTAPRPFLAPGESYGNRENVRVPIGLRVAVRSIEAAVVAHAKASLREAALADYALAQEDAEVARKIDTMSRHVACYDPSKNIAVQSDLDISIHDK